MAVERQHLWVESNVVARVVIAFSLAIGAIIAADHITTLIGVRSFYGLVFATCMLPLVWFYERCFPSRIDRIAFFGALFSITIIFNLLQLLANKLGVIGPEKPVQDVLVYFISALSAMCVGSKVYNISTRWRLVRSAR